MQCEAKLCTCGNCIADLIHLSKATLDGVELQLQGLNAEQAFIKFFNGDAVSAMTYVDKLTPATIERLCQSALLMIEFIKMRDEQENKAA